MFEDANERLNKAVGGRIGFAKGDRGKGEYKRGSLSNRIENYRSSIQSLILISIDMELKNIQRVIKT